MTPQADEILLSIFPRHDQSNNLDTIQSRLKAGDCFPTYDFIPARERIKKRVKNGGQ